MKQLEEEIGLSTDQLWDLAAVRTKWVALLYDPWLLSPEEDNGAER